MNRFVPLLLGLAVVPFAHARELDKPWTLEFETGIAATRYNNAQVPNPGGTNVNLAGLVGRDWRGFGRMALLFDDRAGGTWKFLFAPFQQNGTGNLGGPTLFDGQNFNAGAVEANYRFDSYRLTYRKPWRGGWSVGGTLKIRSAEIRLQQGATRASERNVGFVPLLNIHGVGELGGGFRYEVEMDGLAGGPGRAFDISVRAKRDFGSATTGFIGLRVLEGGADVPRVKNFAWVSYVTAGVSYRF